MFENGRQRVRAQHTVLLHLRELLRSQLSGLQQYGIRYTDLSNVMKLGIGPNPVNKGRFTFQSLSQVGRIF